MTREELDQLYPITVKPYNHEWKIYFERERELLHRIFSLNLKIEHIGSTAVPGLSAKPTIDILIEKPYAFSDSAIIETFENNGFIHMQEQKKHLMFVKGYAPTGLEDISYHIHMGPLEQEWLWDRIYFRDYLNQHEIYKKKYLELKNALAEKYKNDRETYTSSKADFIKKVTIEAKNALQ